MTVISCSKSSKLTLSIIYCAADFTLNTRQIAIVYRCVMTVIFTN
ncbi:MAG: hypothetical protein OFPII_15930 [Osedax symbiont Rs1]|nr:MAG: hypothetical protein OFPII_15930 [Osedax symbiont Rs1]